ncbi:hypothetical protein HNQ41_001833 [Texcoconibacillus texcoconensis]|uniref:Uncharacterized protein n=1 Tax=Texcoconibacillus texcoconensis TaxID=1095777 RepID=A0A840QQJ3_9BACI|nr:hypothetical protein [Texcoconibacillus texcoconensis]
MNEGTSLLYSFSSSKSPKNASVRTVLPFCLLKESEECQCSDSSIVFSPQRVRRMARFGQFYRFFSSKSPKNASVRTVQPFCLLKESEECQGSDSSTVLSPQRVRRMPVFGQFYRFFSSKSPKNAKVRTVLPFFLLKESEECQCSDSPTAIPPQLAKSCMLSGFPK